MTKEEAIERLKNYTQYRCGGVDLVALNMVIQALEQEPCNDTVSRGVFEQVMWERDTAIEQLRKLGYGLGQKIEPCDDAVSRQAVIDALKEGTNVCDLITRTREMRIDIIDVIKALPSVNPTRAHGKWIQKEYWSEGCGMGETYGYYYECSKCGNLKKGGYDRCGVNYCPNCGAEMR